VWHASGASTKQAQAEILATYALAGAGDAEKGEWIETSLRRGCSHQLAGSSLERWRYCVFEVEQHDVGAHVEHLAQQLIVVARRE